MTSGTDIDPDGYPTTTLAEWEIISVVYPTEPFFQPVDQVHPRVPPCGEENGRLLAPILLGVPAIVRR